MGGNFYKSKFFQKRVSDKRARLADEARKKREAEENNPEKRQKTNDEPQPSTSAANNQQLVPATKKLPKLSL